MKFHTNVKTDFGYQKHKGEDLGNISCQSEASGGTLDTERPEISVFGENLNGWTQS